MRKTLYFEISGLKYSNKEAALKLAQALNQGEDVVKEVTENIESKSDDIIKSIKLVEEYEDDLATWSKLDEKERIKFKVKKPIQPKLYSIIKRLQNKFSLNDKINTVFDARFLTSIYYLKSENGQGLEINGLEYKVPPLSDESTVEELFEIIKLAGGLNKLENTTYNFGKEKLRQLYQVAEETRYWLN